ncbi:A nuclease of the HNH/ENDO VII superfamily with conserved LHH [Lachnospiraceae bacterium RM5]|nr:A nuclease of the HNH/ENDO VII superfamily with conserved LHH [Lachnospiraceae bacterium RM5]
MKGLKRVMAVILSMTLFVITGCSNDNKKINNKGENESTETSIEFTNLETDTDFKNLDDEKLITYLEDTVYNEVVSELNSDEYLVENVSAVYISKEYIEELEYNSQSNIFFGYTLSELNEVFNGTKYVFTLGDDGKTTVKEVEEYDDTYEKALKNIAIGTGVILVCVTVSAVTAGAGAPAVSMIFAASAKTGAIMALSGGTIGGVSAGIITGVQTGDFEEAKKAAIAAGSESFKWGAISGAVVGGTSEAFLLKGMTANGLTMDEAAIIQKESKYPVDVIKQFKSMDEYNVFKDANLKPMIVDGKTALVKTDIDLKYVDEMGRSNLERMRQGLAPLDSKGNPYNLHHIAQKNNGTLAVLTQDEHQTYSSILHDMSKSSEIDRTAFNKIREEFWKSMANSLG